MEDSHKVIAEIINAGVDLESIYQELLDEGVKAFEQSYIELIDIIGKKKTSLMEGC